MKKWIIIIDQFFLCFLSDKIPSDENLVRCVYLFTLQLIQARLQLGQARLYLGQVIVRLG